SPAAGRCSRSAASPAARRAAELCALKTGATTQFDGRPARRASEYDQRRFGGGSHKPDWPVKGRAAVLEEFGRPLVIDELDLADPRPGEVLVRLIACGVCHTDMYTASGVDPSGYAPTVLGHEGAGLVERVGEDVHTLAPGDHVVTLFSPQ